MNSQVAVACLFYLSCMYYDQPYHQIGQALVDWLVMSLGCKASRYV